ncbi:GntR family transcriptional regulator [Salisediminibacterium selenitireducens]|uniref:Transcriptional regulator, GntR family n=1 Tax=Bacillus selenitireducens (strain ATCC 700615 / DSM 15326 / MLS10) TaxID=439292 RepID=D6XUB1_BACIE|nr:GntR family transcriptional regulator [Salisediminibacterium selenitireducens]ADH99397.1 transcriptional regulator, GntR family [[Bacillus] selenitireducens MLS10]
MGINFDNHRPIYVQIMAYINSQITRGVWKPGEKLPSVREFAIEVGVNPNTVSRTYMELERQEIVVSKRGQGTFVTEDTSVIQALKKTQASSQVDAFIGNMQNLGLTKHEILSLIQERLKDDKEAADHEY